MKKWLVLAGMCAFLASPGAHAADMSCAGKNFVFFPGGPEGGSFASIVYAGAKLAADQTGCKVDYVWSDWNPQKMVQQFSEAIARKPTGISIMGHPGEEALGPLIDQAEKAGIIVTVSNVPLPNKEAEYKADGFGYAGAADLLQAGKTLGDGAIKACGLKAGDTVFVWGLLGQAGRGQRTQGVIDAMKAANIKVEYQEISDAINGDATQGIPVFASFAASHPEIKAVITDHGGLTATIPAYMQGRWQEAGRDLRRRLRPVGPDRQGRPGRLHRGGRGSAALPAGLPADHRLYLTSKFGFAGLHVDTLRR